MKLFAIHGAGPFVCSKKKVIQSELFILGCHKINSSV